MEVPWIFLSHSGKQKEFTRCLYHQLKRVGHHPFFDQDPDRSLPKGQPFPTRILDACRRCKMGVVVLSDDYMNSMWPMVELEQFCFHNPSILIYPLFYRLQPADLSSVEKLTQWQNRWDSRESVWPARCSDSSSSSHRARIAIDIDMRSWPKAVKMLKFQNGEVLPNGMTDYAWIEKIVSNICKTLPPPQRYLLSEHTKGGDRMQLEMDQLFDELPIEANGVIPLGVHGKGGSGKTTLCKMMTNFYNKDFPGRSILLEFPFEENKEELLDALKNTLSILVHIKEEDLKRLCYTEEVMGQLEEVLKRHKVFLAIDNVWQWNLENARQIIRMKYVEGSKVMVTSRSEKVLQHCMSPINIVQVPCISEEEAVEVLRSYGNERSLSLISEEDLRSLFEFLSIVEECHPWFLKRIGASLGHVHNSHHTFVDYKSFVSTYAENCSLHAIEDICQLLIGLSALFIGSRFEKLKNDFEQLQIELSMFKSEIEVGTDELKSTIKDAVDQIEGVIELGVDQFESKIKLGVDQLESKIERVDKFKSKIELGVDKLKTGFNDFLSSIFDD